MITAFVVRCESCRVKAVVFTRRLASRSLNLASLALVNDGWLIGSDEQGSTHRCPNCAEARRAELKAQAEADKKLRDAFLRKVHKTTKEKRKTKKDTDWHASTCQCDTCMKSFKHRKSKHKKGKHRR